MWFDRPSRRGAGPGGRAAALGLRAEFRGYGGVRCGGKSCLTRVSKEEEYGALGRAADASSGGLAIYPQLGAGQSRAGNAKDGPQELRTRGALHCRVWAQRRAREPGGRDRALVLARCSRDKATGLESPVRSRNEPAVVAHFYPPHSGGKGKRISEFEPTLVYRMSCRTAEKPCLKNPK